MRGLKIRSRSTFPPGILDVAEQFPIARFDTFEMGSILQVLKTAFDSEKTRFSVFAKRVCPALRARHCAPPPSRAPTFARPSLRARQPNGERARLHARARRHAHVFTRPHSCASVFARSIIPHAVCQSRGRLCAKIDKRGETSTVKN